MTQYSKVPFVHEWLSKLSYPGASWSEVIHTEPSLDHLHWAFLFAIFSAVLQLFCYATTKLFASTLIGFSSTPPLPRHVKSKAEQSYYRRVGEAVRYTRPIELSQYDCKALSATHCDGQLSAKEIERFLIACNEHHLECRKNETRFQESLFPILTKTFTLTFGVYISYDQAWLYDRNLFYVGWPHEQGLDGVADIKLLYIAHIGWYVYKLFGQTLLDRHLKDFMAALVHHCTTIVLMSLSYHASLLRVGVAVLLCHDPSDIILHGAKLMRLLQQTICMNVLFASLVIAWFVTRLLVFPYHCVLSTFLEFKEQHGNKNTHDDVVISCCSFLMTTLFILHLHWFWLIVKAVRRTLSGKPPSDPRSDNEADQDSQQQTNSTKK
eukprot:CAMPEP_0202712974 /NCGR_PEP_ID=MMETSP1385-20130828/47708_1 /ASSEMBLY_ACC=CAM_ASM_000861 /TAXON_ID=933848 /ORGANISM="Elphidium margaritaceum" /LENGTH=379 /DNA_ID=CAMNT_0049373177 /DNA_START=24 /DNA_END=1163 /DNA_ORIENTATION=+